MLTEVQFLNAKVVSPYEYRQISDLKVGYMPRGLDASYVEELTEILRDGGKFYDNIAIFEDGELIDGLHRLEAYKRTNLLTILVQVWKCPKENRTALKIHLNSAHGKQLSRREKQESYFELIQENPEITDEQAARVFGVTERTIQRWKPEAMKQKRLSQEEVRKIHELKEEGKTQREIANEIGVNQNTVQHHLNKNDNCHICSDSTPTHFESEEAPNVIKAPVKFQRPEPLPNDEDDDEDDLNIESDDPGTIVVKPINWKEKGNKFVEAMITASAFEKALEIDSNGGFPDNMKEIFAEAILLMQRNLPRYLEYFMTTNSIERR